MYFCPTDALGQIYKGLGWEETFDSKQQICLMSASLVLYNPNANANEQSKFKAPMLINYLFIYITVNQQPLSISLWLFD